MPQEEKTKLATDDQFLGIVELLPFLTGGAVGALGGLLGMESLGIGVGAGAAAAGGLPALAVAGSAAAGFGAGLGMAAMTDMYGMRFHDENGMEHSAFDEAAEWGHGAQHAVDGLAGKDSTIGNIAGATVAGLSSIPLGIAGALGGLAGGVGGLASGLYDWVAN